MKGLVDFFDDEVPKFSDSKALTTTEIPTVTRYSRELYFAVRLLLSCDQSIYIKLVEDMSNSYALSQYKYPRTRPKM